MLLLSPILFYTLSQSSSCPSFPELPVYSLLPPLTISAFHSPPIQREPSKNKCHHQQRLQRLCKHSSTEQEQADATEYYRRRDPALIRAFEIGLFDAENDESKNRKEIESVPSDTVECCKSSKTPHDNINHSQSCIEHHGVCWCVEQANSIVGDESSQTRYLRRAIWETDSAVLAKTNLTKEGG